jgi:hypothetical protein
MNKLQRALGTKWYITIGVLIGQLGVYISVWYLWAIAGVIVGAVLGLAQQPLAYSVIIAVGVAVALKVLGFVLRVIGGVAMRHMLADAMAMTEKHGLRSWDEIRKEIR